MSPDKLIYMANQIAIQLSARPGDEAVVETANHISSFWEPRMRTQLFELMDQEASKFNPIVLKARPRIRPVSVESAT